MPAIESRESTPPEEQLTELPFKPITKKNILNCSYHAWYPKYRHLSIESRLIPVTPAFLSYLHEDGVWIPDDDDDEPYTETEWSFENAHKPEDPSYLGEAKPNDATPFSDIHDAIRDTIKELGGTAIPKLNWSAPKDTTHMIPRQNTMVCDRPSDVYMLLKTSVFVQFDLQCAYNGCSDWADGERELTLDEVPYTIVLRKEENMDPMWEFRCFVRDRTLVAICQRARKRFGYSDPLIRRLQNKIEDFFVQNLRSTFEDPDFVFDIWIPEPHDRVVLIDINPWAPRTDPILFSWLELLQLQPPPALLGVPESTNTPAIPEPSDDDMTEDDDDDIEEMGYKPEFRVVRAGDPEESMGASPFGAYKVPDEVYVAGKEGGPSAVELLAEQVRVMNGGPYESDED